MPKKCFYQPARLRMRYDSVGKQLWKNYLRRAQEERGYGCRCGEINEDRIKKNRASTGKKENQVKTDA